MFAREYRHSPSRPSALGVEIRKDLIYDLDERGYPRASRPEVVEEIAALIARAVHTYFTLDLHERNRNPRW